MRGTIGVLMLSAAVFAVAGETDWAAMEYTPHFAYQAVDGQGFGTFPLNAPVKLRGVLLNRGADLLDPTPDLPSFLGGQWQVFVQASGDADQGGTALFMAQRYSDLPFVPPGNSYTAEEWLAELHRLMHDPATGHPFAPGDLVEVRARAPGLFFRGKTNVNEVHRKTPATDFDIVLLQAGFGRSVTDVPLSFVKDAADQFIFDPQRLTGCEWLQGTLVRFRDVTFVSTAGWAPNATLTVQDGTGRTFPVRLGRGAGLATCPAPVGPVTLVGIFDQEDDTPADGWRGGYRLWVPAYAGYVVPSAAAIPGDVNCDGVVGFDDIGPLVLALGGPEGYLTQYPCCPHTNADCNGDGAVDFDDIDAFVALLGS